MAEDIRLAKGEDVDNLRETIEQIQNSDKEKYSYTPQRIGTWVDGTPIWIAAFDCVLTDDNWLDGDVNIPNFGINSPSLVFIIDIYAAFYYGGPCMIDDITALRTVQGRITIPTEVKKENGYNGIHGWVKFVTPEGNIRNSNGKEG